MEGNNNKNIYKKIIFFVLATVVLIVCLVSPAPNGLTVKGKDVLGIFLWYLIVLIGGCLPLGIVGIVAPALLVILNIYPEKVAMAGFINDMSFLILGALMFGAAMNVTNLGKRIALSIVSFMRSSKVTRINLGLLLANLILCPFFPATVARGAFFYPIVNGINSLIKGNDKKASILRSSFLLWGVGLAPIFVATFFLTGAMPSLMVVATYSTYGIHIGWIQWFILTVPAIGLLPILYLYFHKYYKLRNIEILGSKEAIKKELTSLGKLSKEEILLLIALISALILWILSPFGLSAGMAAILVTILIFLPIGLKYGWKEINAQYLWGTWLFLAGSISLANVLTSSGLTNWLSKLIVDMVPSGLPVIIVILMLMLGFQIARAGISSAVAMAAAYIPLSICLAPLLHLNPLPFTILIVTTLSYAFILPFSIETVLIAWSAGDVSFSEVIKFGTPLTIIATIYCVLVLIPWFSLVGFPLWK
ncbi:MAG: DASS family sodium-coupled anion symporter [Candidatus Nanopusillus acidilobi]|jgi:anion transporter